MSVVYEQLKKISTFLYVLIFLFLFNVIFNLNYDWYGISFIVRSYLFIFSFYLIYNFSEINAAPLKEHFAQRYGRKGAFLLFLQIRVLPFAIIYAITIVFILIDYVRLSQWPIRPLLSLIDGRYSNILIYSLLLLLILKIKRGPAVTIPLFLIFSVMYFFVDKFMYSYFESGIVISIFKLLKFILFLFFLLYEFFYVREKIVGIVLSAFSVGTVLFSVIILMVVWIFSTVPALSYQNLESSMMLLKLGFSFPLDDLKRHVLVSPNVKLFKELLEYSSRYGVELEYDYGEWEAMLFSESLAMTDTVSKHILDKNIPLKYERIVSYAEKESMVPDSKVHEAVHFVALASRYIEGHEHDLIDRLQRGNDDFKLWGMAVLAQQRRIESIPVLLEYLTDININLSEGAYRALHKISGLDPKEHLNTKITDPAVYITFKDFYIQNRTVK